MGLTSILTCYVNTVGTLAAPAPLTVAFPANANLRFTGYDLLAGQALQSDDAPIVRQYRIWSNFADGLVFPNLYTRGGVVGSPRPHFNLFGSGNGAPAGLPATFISCAAQTFNEWYPVNVPLPMFERTRGLPAYLYAHFSADLPDPTTQDVTFNVAGINTAFNGERPAFVIQVQLETAY